MIVDLLRNDLSRVSVPGSVKVPALFTVESYPHVHTMTSTVTAHLADSLSATDVLAAIFPCGSITGAPKIRAMEIISEIECTPRGVYTGSIGRIDPNGDAAFNVAIRTLHCPVAATVATLGLGSGIVADSEAHAEWQECADKGAFIASPIAFDLIETMRFDPDGGITLLDGHIARLGASAKQFGFMFNRHDVRNALQAAMIRHAEPRRIRLMLAKCGGISIEIGKLPPSQEGVIQVAVAPLPVDTADLRLRHKTSDRAFYDDARRTSGAFEVLFTDREGYLTEGSFTNIFVPRNGVLLTPSAQRGLLPGVFRAALLARGDAQEADLTPDDLHEGFFIGNALRGLIAAILV
jgi:para-aminobenzoate synthetase/4-amino-4-deoxychorismate lyase